MSPQLALGLTVALICWLFRRDMRLRELPSPALWIPALWLIMIGSRPLSLWLQGINGIPLPGMAHIGASEGSPLDMAVFLGLIASAVVVLSRRSLDWPAFLQANKALIIIYLYLALSAAWSEHSLPTFKRAIKDFGNVLVALVLLTEVDPLTAIRIVYVRISYLLFPLSVVFIEYFPGHWQTSFARRFLSLHRSIYAQE